MVGHLNHSIARTMVIRANARDVGDKEMERRADAVLRVLERAERRAQRAADRGIPLAYAMYQRR